jgi:hypothetical protein
VQGILVAEAEGDAELDAVVEGVAVVAEGVDDVAAGEASPTDLVDGADFVLVHVSKFPSARSNAVLKSGSCCFNSKLFMVV